MIKRHLERYFLYLSTLVSIINVISPMSETPQDLSDTDNAILHRRKRQTGISGAFCPSGMTPLYVGGTTAIQGCSTLVDNCEPGFRCHPAITPGSSSDQGICCATSNLVSTVANYPTFPSHGGVCPVGETAYLIQGIPLTCNLPIDNCPPNHRCTEVTVGQHLHNICCSKINTAAIIAGRTKTSFSQMTTGYCPAGTMPFINGYTPQICNMQLQNCPPSFACTVVHTTIGLTQSICCSQPHYARYSNFYGGQAATLWCPVGYSQLIRHGTAVSCNPMIGLNACPLGYFCHPSFVGMRFMQYSCCGNDASIAGNPAGQIIDTINQLYKSSFQDPTANIPKPQPPPTGRSPAPELMCQNGIPATNICGTAFQCAPGQQCVDGLCCFTVPPGNCPPGLVSIMGKCKRLTCQAI